MNIYRHKLNKKLYLVSHLVLEHRYANCNETAGIYAEPYNWKGDNINFKSKDSDECSKFVDDNFIIVSEK